MKSEDAKATILQKLAEIQQELRVPKNHKNKFAGFNYRSAEDIVEKVKPLCHTRGLALILGDELAVVGTELVAVATATITDGTEKISAKSFAQVDTTRKGFDRPQLSGASISYARKYAMGGLFGIDDGNDPDSITPTKREPQAKTPPETKRELYDPPKPTVKGVKMATANQRKLVNDLLKKENISGDGAVEWLEEQAGLDKNLGLTAEQASKAISILLSS